MTHDAIKSEGHPSEAELPILRRNRRCARFGEHRKHATTVRTSLHAFSLGWPLDRRVIDTDLGPVWRLGRRPRGSNGCLTKLAWAARIVLGVEVYRLARNSMDWHRLLESLRAIDSLNPG